MSMNGDQQKGFIIQQGTSREERVLKALLPENVRIDGRKLHEWLAFSARAARLIRYYNPSNEPSGNWAPFLEKDPSIFLAMVLDNHPEEWSRNERGIVQRFYAAWDEGDQKIACRDLVVLIADMAFRLDEWYRGSESLLKSGSNSPLAAVLEKAIQSELSGDMRKFWEILLSLRAKKLLDAEVEVETRFAGFHSAWNLQYPPSLPGTARVDALKSAVEAMRRIFQRLHFAMTFVSEKAPVWFQDSLDLKDDHDPHTALLLTFLHLFEHVRDQINTYPRHHLEHYYLDLLQQRQKKLVPDRTVVCFQLAEHVESYRIEKGALLLASVNEAGLESRYATTEALPMTQARIAALRTIFISKSDTIKIGSSYRLVSGIYAAPVADSRDGMGAPFTADDRSWPVFGEEQIDKSPGDRRMTDAEIGFVIAAPILALQEGNREIDVQFRFTDVSFSMLVDLLDDISQNTGKKGAEVVSEIFSKSFHVFVSGVNGWFRVKQWQIDPPDAWLQNNTLTLTMYLFTDDPAIVDNNPEVLGASFDTPWPLVKILLDTEHVIYAYSFTHFLELEMIRVETRVKGLKSLTLINELGLLDASSPFTPFGPMPKRNAYLMLGSAELFRKRLTDLVIHMEWNNLPEAQGGFAEHYKEYNNGTENASFQLGLSALSNHTFRPLDAEKRQTFPAFVSKDSEGHLKDNVVIEGVQLDRLQIQPDYTLRELPEYSNKVRSGYFKLQLSNPPMAFGHAEYPRLFSKAMIAQSRPGGIFGRNAENDGEQDLPREPYLPVINKLTVSYKASTTLNMRPLESGDNDEAAHEKVICLHPFGQQTIFADGKVTDRFLLPQFERDGYLFVGLSDVKPGQTISLLFHIRESKQKTWINNLDVRWGYLHTNRWDPLTQESLLSDGTNQFTTTGIIKIIVPADIRNDNTIMPPGLYWLCAAAKGNLNIAGRVLGVQINAVEAVWVDNGDPFHFDDPGQLPPIRELVQQRPEIAGLTQPIEFYGGRRAEQMAELYVRTSERLRHKNRIIDSWDIEHAVLAQFPAVREVKCINWMEYKNTTPGEITVVVIPRAQEDDLEPMLGFHQLDVIRDFLKQRTSPFVQIRVINPVYEKIKVTCAVLLQKGLESDKGMYREMLQEGLLHKICPWLRGGMVGPGGKISKNDILAFIKSLPYIRFVTRFSLVKIFEQTDMEAGFDLTDTARQAAASEVLVPETPWSVFSPVAQHNISFTTDEKLIAAQATAIEEMRLGTDFIVLGEPEDAPPPADLKLFPGAKSKDAEQEWFLIPK